MKPPSRSTRRVGPVKGAPPRRPPVKKNKPAAVEAPEDGRAVPLKQGSARSVKRKTAVRDKGEVEGVAELVSTVQGLQQAFEQLSEKVDTMQGDKPVKRARTTEVTQGPSRHGRRVQRSSGDAAQHRRGRSSSGSARQRSSHLSTRPKARGRERGGSGTSSRILDETESEDSSGEVSSEGDGTSPPSDYWAVAAHEPGLPAWAIHRRALTARVAGGPAAVWEEVDVSDPSSIVSTYSNGEDPPGRHLSDEVRDSILDGYYVDVFTLHKKRGDEARTLKSGKKEKKDKNEEVERTFINWVSGYLVYAGVVATAYPDRGWHLLNHMSNVVKARILAGEGPAIEYDETCRKMASRDDRARWDLLQDKIWLLE
ncbi:UNVERIFIED_CONTAM: hypothetical protein K2H54_012798, partial [Gekko kuhli]